jgi:hypothetical protein
MAIILEAPINSLSFGNVSFNILRAFYKAQEEVNWFPLGGNADLSVFDEKKNLEFYKWLSQSANKANSKIAPDQKTIKIWHLNGSQSRVGSKQLLYTFYELDQPTEQEINLAKFQTKIFFSSSHAAKVFQEFGVDAEYAPLGFDPDFYVTGKKYLSDEVTHFGLMGKFEKRKHTKKIIQLWLQVFGNNPKYQLSVCCLNPFYSKEEMNALLVDCLEGKRYSNINFISFMEKNHSVNDFLNSIDIDLTGLSGAEGWNLPAFNATCLGKWSIVLNATAHKDWASSENSILIEPNGKEPAYDNKFFLEGAHFNQGYISTWDRDEVAQAMRSACDKKGQKNTNGEALKEIFSYENLATRLNKGLQAM